MIIWEPDDRPGSGDSWLAIAVGVMLIGWLYSHGYDWYLFGLPTWWPDPVNGAALLFVGGALCFGIAIARRSR